MPPAGRPPLGGGSAAALAPRRPRAVHAARRHAVCPASASAAIRVLAATMGALEELGHLGVACDDPFAAPGIVQADPTIELVISDVLMPRQTGPEMIAGLTARFPHLAVLFVTGFAGDAGGADEFGGHHVLRKPYTLVGIERAIAAAMADRLPHPEQIAAE